MSCDEIGCCFDPIYMIKYLSWFLRPNVINLLYLVCCLSVYLLAIDFYNCEILEYKVTNCKSHCLIFSLQM